MLYNKLPRGVFLLTLRGAICNLIDAIDSGKVNLILSKRKELHRLLSRAKLIDYNRGSCQSILSLCIMDNLIVEIDKGEAILRRATSLLSSSLALA